MTLLENLFGDLTLVLLQNGLARWGAALAASLWVWLIGDEEARLRRFYLFAPFAVAALIEAVAFIGGGPGGMLSRLLAVQEAAAKIASPAGLGAVLIAALLGYLRGIGFVVALAVLVAAYLSGGLGNHALAGLWQGLSLLPTLLAVLLMAYGIGATVRRVRGR